MPFEALNLLENVPPKALLDDSASSKLKKSAHENHYLYVEDRSLRHDNAVVYREIARRDAQALLDISMLRSLLAITMQRCRGHRG